MFCQSCSSGYFSQFEPLKQHWQCIRKKWQLQISIQICSKQELPNQYDITIIRIFAIDGHGKSEVDSVCGIAKSSVRIQIARRDYFGDSADVVEFLIIHFQIKATLLILW